MKKAIIIIISALVVLGGVFAGLWFFTDILNFLKPANENFCVQLDKVLGTEKNLSYSEYESKISKLKIDGSYSTDFNVSMNVNVPSSVLSYSDQKLINSSSLNLKTDYDADTKATAIAVALSNNSREVIKAQAILDGVKLSINSEDLYDKYLTFDLDKYESFCKENGIQVDSDTKEAIATLSKLNQIDSNTLAYDLLHVSEDDYKELQKTYDDLPKQLIDKKKFKTQKNQKITVGDKDDVKTTAYSVVLTGEDAYNMTKKLIGMAKDDDTLKKVIVEKYDILKDYIASYEEVLSSTSSSNSLATSSMPDVTKDDIDDLLDELLDELEYSEDDFKDMDGAVKITIYSDKKNNPVKLEIELLEDEDDKEGTIIFTKEMEKGKDTYTIDLSILANTVKEYPYEDYTSSTSSYTSSSYSTNSSSSASNLIDSVASSITGIKIVDEYSEKTKDSKKGTLTVSLKTTGSKYQEILDVDYEIIDSDSEEKIKLSASTPLQSTISFDLLYDMTGLDTNTKNVKFSFEGKYTSYSVSMNIEGTIKSGANIPTLTSANSVDVLTLKQDELINLYTQIVNNAANNLPSKLATFGINVSKDKILSLLPTASVEPATEPAPAEVPAA